MSKKSISNKSTNTRSKMNVDSDLVELIQSRINSLLAKKNGSWNGTMTDLSKALTTGVKRAATKNWPKTPSVLRRVINTVVPALRRAGIRTEFTRSTDHNRTRVVSFSQR